MKSKIGNFIFIIIAILLAIFFINLTIQQTNFEVLFEALKRANYFWYFVSMALSILSYWFRAARWKLLLEPIGYSIRTSSGFWAISFAYFMNLTIPRSGEIARATSLYKMEKVPADKSLGTIVLERVIDLFFLLSFFILTLVFNAQSLSTFLSMGNTPSLTKLIGILGIDLVGVILLFVFHKKLIQLKIYKRIILFLLGIWAGFKSILHLKERVKFIAYSFGIWTCYFLMTYLVVFAYPETSHFGLAEGFFLIVTGSLGMILPAVGGLGYPYVMSIAFAALFLASGKTAEEGKNIGNYFGLILYFAQIIAILLFGLLSFYYIAKTKPTTESK